MLRRSYWFFLGGFACWFPVAVIELFAHRSIVALDDPLGLLLSILVPPCCVYAAYSWLAGRKLSQFGPALWMIAGTQMLATAFLELGAAGWRGSSPPFAGMSETAFILTCSIPPFNLYYVGESGKLFGLVSADLVLLVSARLSARHAAPQERRA